jgi:catechol 2,3-dioxygenase-like lactoylglutathione lyase family enzyme
MLKDARIVAILPAVDIERAKEFYSEKLDLPTLGIPVPEDSVLFESGDGTMLYVYETEGGTQADHTAAGWMVESIEDSVNDLRDKGVAFEEYDMPGLETDERGIAKIDGAKSAWFKDTEGNILSIFETA